MRHLIFALPLIAATFASAQEAAVDPAEFGQYAEGYTLYFEEDGQPAGAEKFDEGGAVTWRTPEGECIEGLWRAYDGQMCFYYQGDSRVRCWDVLRDEAGFMVRSEPDEEGPGVTFRVTGRDRKPLLCGAPGVKT